MFCSFYNKTILETSSEILSNMVKSSTFSTNHNRSYTLLTLVQRMLENLRIFFVETAICTFTGIRTPPSLSDLYGRRSR